jgi:hypothetical protein
MKIENNNYIKKEDIYNYLYKMIDNDIKKQESKNFYLKGIGQFFSGFFIVYGFMACIKDILRFIYGVSL